MMGLQAPGMALVPATTIRVHEGHQLDQQLPRLEAFVLQQRQVSLTRHPAWLGVQVPLVNVPIPPCSVAPLSFFGFSQTPITSWMEEATPPEVSTGILTPENVMTTCWIKLLVTGKPVPN